MIVSAVRFHSICCAASISMGGLEPLFPVGDGAVVCVAAASTVCACAAPIQGAADDRRVARATVRTMAVGEPNDAGQRGEKGAGWVI